jgi:hypothetical protein
VYVCIKLLNYKIINIIHIYVFYVNIKMCMYHIVLRKIKMFYIYFSLGLGEFKVCFDKYLYPIYYSLGKVTIKKPNPFEASQGDIY